MVYRIYVQCDECCYSFQVLPFGNSQRIEVPDVVILDLFKYHNHRYDLQAFFYKEKVICSFVSFKSKKELFGAIQNLLQKYL